MKKILSLILICLLTIPIFFSGCKKSENKNITLYAPDGAPSLSIVNLIGDNLGQSKVEVNVVSATLINTAITTFKADFVIMPVLSATKLYNTNSNNVYQMLAVITHGNFFLVSSFSIANDSDLIGKVILIPQNENTVPDLTLKAILQDKGLDYQRSDEKISNKVALSYKGSGSAVIGSLPKDGSSDYIALLPEPASTLVKTKKSAYSYNKSIQSMYDSESESYPQAVLMAKKSTIDSNPTLIGKIKTAIENSIEYSKSNPANAVSKIKEIFSASELSDTLTANSVINCNIFWGSAESERQNVINYISRIREINSNSANIVNESFFR